MRWFAGLRLVVRAEAWIGRRPPYAVLTLLAMPFAIVEPLKIVALVVMAHSAFAAGLVLLGLGHLASFLIVERIYRAGEAQLMTIGWLAAVMRRITRVRDAVLGWLRSRPAWQRLAGRARRLRARIAARARSFTNRPRRPDR